jgi:4-amino-4-deoxy-L-arabinose transferase-like glycosyltransferase
MSVPHFLRRHSSLLFYSGWFLLGLLQAIFTELQDDEAYYWVYARFLDWGYFDHPPLTALLIKGGTALFSNELGVRIFPLLLNTATLWLTEQLIPARNRLLFYALCLSAAVLQIIGFWAVPDVPLLFFTALFFWCYRNFLKDPYGKNIIVLALACALLLYTKYHGAIIILFTLFSNLRLLKQWPIYAAGGFALLLFLPHLFWQYQHDWVSFRYHLFESNVNRYKFSYTTDYMAGQLLLAGPLAGPIFLWATFRCKAMDKLEKALQFTAIGIFLFFLAASFKGKVEANWTAPALIPMLVLTHQYLQRHGVLKKWLYRLLPATVVLVLAARIIMLVDLVPAKPVVQRFHAWKGWPQKLAAITKGHPLVFNNSYQRASKIWFYTGQMSYSLNSHQERRSNYNFWPIEDSLLGKPVYLMDIYNVHTFSDSLQARQWTIGYRKDSAFQAFARIQLHSEVKRYIIERHDTLLLHLRATVPPAYQAYLQQHPETDQPVVIGVFKGRDWVKDIPTPLRLQHLVRQPLFQIPIVPGLEPGRYFIRLAVGTSTPLYTHNSDKIDVTVR